MVPCHVAVAQILIEDPRVRLITFTGSAAAGWAIRAKAGTKRVVLELGGNAGVIIEPDADLAWAAARCAMADSLMPGSHAFRRNASMCTRTSIVRSSMPSCRRSRGWSWETYSTRKPMWGR